MIESAKVSVAGGHLTATVSGGGEPVVLIHGTAPPLWCDLPDSLARDHRVIAYDRRSFGSARDMQARSLTEHATDAAAVIGQCGVGAVIVGWSIGAVIALEVAATAPELVAGLVLLEPALHLKRHPRPRMISAIVGATVLGRIGRPEAGARRFLRWALGRRDGGDDLDRMPREWHARLAAGDGAAVVGELAAGTGEHLDAALLRRIEVPVQVLRGDRSQPVFAAAAARAAGAVREATLLDVAGSGHAVQVDAPQRVADGVSALRAGPTPRPPAR